MSTNSVSTTIPFPNANPQNSTNQTTYLNRCIENLVPERVTSHEAQATKWRVIATISTVAFFALAIGAFIATSIFLPAYLPIAGISAILMAIPAVQQVQKLMAWAEDAQAEANKYRGIQHEYADLNAKQPVELQRELLKMGILWTQIPGIQVQHPEQLSQLNPLLAHAKYLENQTKAWMDQKDQHANEAQQAANEPQKKAQEQRYALRCEDIALTCKIKNAFYQAILRNPGFNGTFDSLGALSKNSFEERMLGSALNDPAASRMFTFNNAAIVPITYADAKALTVAELGQRFFTAMGA